ncbi:MAG: nucleotide sugar dehydrogenase [Candidatus Eisenbacteria bacterium]
MSTICVTGIWHQGTVLTGCFAELGHSVRGVSDGKILDNLKRGIPPVHEPSLPEILRRNLESGRLTYTKSFSEAIQGAEFVFISTDTPVDVNDDSDLSSVFALAESIGPHIDQDAVLCVTAQVPIGTSAALAEAVRLKSGHRSCNVAYVPEFLRLGSAVDSFRSADRFAIGCDDPTTAQRVGALFEPLGRPLVYTDVRSAEMAKHASNAFLAMSISFINEIADLAELLGADALEVARILKLDKRIGSHAFLSPGLGYAGGTLGRDVRVLQHFGSASGAATSLLDAVRVQNLRRGQLPARRLSGLLDGLAKRRIGILGLTYKPGTSTMRRAISLEVVKELVDQGASVAAFDPLADLSEVSQLPPMRIGADPYDVAKGCDAIVLITEWDGIDKVDWQRIRSLMAGDVLLDTRNILDATRIVDAGLKYYGIGRQSSWPQTSEVSV